MQKPSLNLSYHEQDGMLLPNTQISTVRKMTAAGAIWEEGALRPARQLPGSLYGTKNGWITHGNDASDSAGSHRTNGASAPVDVV